MKQAIHRHSGDQGDFRGLDCIRVAGINTSSPASGYLMIRGVVQLSSAARACLDYRQNAGTTGVTPPFERQSQPKAPYVSGWHGSCALLLPSLVKTKWGVYSLGRLSRLRTNADMV